MKTTSVLKTCFAITFFSTVLIFSACKKEAVVTPANTANNNLTTRTTITNDVPVKPSSSANRFYAYLGGEEVRYEGTVIPFNAFVDPDSAHLDHDSNDHDDDAYYQSGSKWVTINTSNSNLSITNASIEVRSLAVRVFVSPIVAVSGTYYNQLGPATYGIASSTNPSKGAVITLRDKNGELWSSLGNQDGSSMVISSRGENMVTYTVVTGTINCKMYNSHGSMKMLTNATFATSLGI